MNGLKLVMLAVCAAAVASLAGCDYGVGTDEDYASLVQGGLVETPVSQRTPGGSKVVKPSGTSTASVPGAATDPAQAADPVDGNPATVCGPASSSYIAPCMPFLPPKTDDRGHGDPLPWKSDQPVPQPE